MTRLSAFKFQKVAIQYMEYTLLLSDIFQKFQLYSVAKILMTKTMFPLYRLGFIPF